MDRSLPWRDSGEFAPSPPAPLQGPIFDTRAPAMPGLPPLPVPMPQSGPVPHLYELALKSFREADYLTATYSLEMAGMVDLYDGLIVPQWSHPFGELLLSQLLVLPRSAHMQVLDIACGTGYPTLEISRYFGADATIVGIDNWEAATRRAQEKANASWLRHLTFIHGDVGHLPLPEQQFDVITCNLGYTSFADRSRVMAVVSRALKPGGAFVMTTPLQNTFREFLDMYYLVLHELQLTTCIDALVALVKSRPTIATTRAALARPGLFVEREITHQFRWECTDAHDFLTSPIVALSYLIGWRAIIQDLTLRRLVFNEVERRLNAKAATEHGLQFTIPMACLVARRPL